MRRSWLSLLLLCLVVCLVCAVRFAAAAAEPLRVNERATQILFGQRQTRITLTVENSAHAALNARLQLDLLDPDDRVRVSATRIETVKPGASRVEFVLTPSLMTTLTDSERAQLMWYRLRYRINRSDDKPDAPALLEGIVSLNQVDAPDLFELHVAAPQSAHGGQTVRAHMRTEQPFTNRAVAGVRVKGELTFDDPDGNDVTVKAAAVTDAQGDAALDFVLPRVIDDEDGNLKLTAALGDFVQEAEAEIKFEHTAQILISTDKPLYQPGQTLHVRALVFDLSKHAVPNADITLTVTDPDDATAFRATMKTSRFGIASVDWPVPDSTRLGNYHVEAKIEDGPFSDSYAGAYVRISRYELPNFVVQIKPDRDFYLPGQNAEVEVRADYLFGEPVKRGHVRVVRETERRWNYREQKWDIEEADKYEGDTDERGRFVAHVDLKAAHADFADENYSRFTDLNYAAYFTDPTTRRTEERRFDLRLTHEPIHIYVVEGSTRLRRGQPLEFYVSTSYADGTPAECNVTISGPLRAADDEDDPPPPALAPPVLRTVRTNKYGVAKVTNLVLPKTATETETDKNDEGEQLKLQFDARDQRGQAGRHTDDFYLSAGHALRVATDKTIYRPGEPVQVEITADVPAAKLALDISRNWQVLRSQLVELHDGRARLTLPFRPEFHDEISITAYAFAPDEDDDEDFPISTRTVIFPHKHDLQLDVQLSKPIYQPGEEAHASFNVRAADGHAAESALGVIVFDKAVEARARTDSEFGPNSFYNLYEYWRGTDAIGGLTRNDLERLDLSQPLPDGLDLVAEMLLRDDTFKPRQFGGLELETDESSVFEHAVAAQLTGLRDVLNGHYTAQSVYPLDEAIMRRLLLTSGIDFTALRDPWGTPYRARFSVAQANDVLEIISAGADKVFDTADDFTALRIERPYFRFTGEAISRAVARYHARTGSFIRDAATLKSELAREGIDLDALRDPWQQPYRVRFDVVQTKFIVAVESSGPNRSFEPADARRSDDFRVWSAPIDYSLDLHARLDDALARYFAATARFPQDVTMLNDACTRAGIAADALRDPWGHPYYATFHQNARYADRVVIDSYARYGQQPKERMEVTPVTQSVNYINLRSAGPDGQAGTADDFDAASFMSIVTEQAATDKTPQAVSTRRQFSSGSGALTGTVTDPLDAVIPNALVQATNKYSGQVFSATTNEEGKYLLRNLPGGLYLVTCSVAGFKNSTITDVPVQSSSLTKLDIKMEVGTVSEAVEVTAGSAAAVQTSSATVSAAKIEELPINGRNVYNLALLAPGLNIVTKSGETATPRLREYFPETLLWQPELTTDRRGRAELNFKLADNITTWKMSVFGSTEDGQIGGVEREIRAFQPFFVEHDPPRVLTEGDEIMLPVVLRNYLDKPQQVNVQLKPADWFTLLTPAEQRADVPAGDATRALFGFRAVASVRDGKQRVTAIGHEASDAIERPVNVHPDGEELAQADMQLLGAKSVIETDVPAHALPHSAHAELKLYPNLLTHVIESVEAIMERPHGCAEQTISSTYPSLLLLRHYRQLRGPAAPLPPIAFKAAKYLHAGYDRLLSYRAPDGGFTYWGRGDSDLALTAYAVRFLEDARALMPIDEDTLQAARAWLVKQQQADGSWPAYDWARRRSDRRTLMLTAYVARILAQHKDKETKNGQAKEPVQPAAAATTSAISAPANAPTVNKDPARAPQASALERALAFLAPHVDDIDEPYFIAAYTLAAIDGDASPAAIAKATTRLRTLAHDEAGASYWALEANTPFYGWGAAGRIETTALVVQALAKAEGGRMKDEKEPANAQTSAPLQPSALNTQPSDDLVGRGLLFLLRNKDRYGVWLSTQATVNVLDALVLLSPTRAPETSSVLAPVSAARASAQPVELFVNGQHAGTLALPADERLDSPLTFDLSPYLTTGRNRVELKRAGAGQRAFAQVVTTYYVPWTTHAQEAVSHAPQASDALRLAVSFDQTSVPAGAELTCHVTAERIGFRGYGMLLAEIGLPPGADVDRASLERAMQESDWALSSYDILPDRLVVYLWPRAGGTRFAFNFRPRYGLKAQSAPSILYDYYNPEARTVLAPTRFNISEPSAAPAAAQR